MTSEQIELVARIIDPSAWEEIDRREALNSDPEYRRAYETSASLKGINAVPWDQVRARLAAPTLEKAARIIASLAPAVPEGWVITTASGTRYRAWGGAGTYWTDDLSDACFYARRCDADRG